MSCLRDWFSEKKHHISGTQLYRGDSLPEVDQFDWLVILGGPMSVHCTDKHSWLLAEKQLIKEAIAHNKIVLGICLGGQLIADVLGAKVQKNAEKEIGWFPIQRDDEIEDTILKGILPKQLNMFHWHGDTFAIPKGAKKIASSAACANQGFVYGERVVALQCHPETTPTFIEYLARAGMDELMEASAYVQSAEQLFVDEPTYQNINRVMFAILDRLEKTHLY
jgi:GMP synthase-like glutamine amidotransferase